MRNPSTPFDIDVETIDMEFAGELW